MTTVDERFDRIDPAMERVTRNADRVCQDLDRLFQIVIDFRKETTEHFQAIESRMDMLAAALIRVDFKFVELTNTILEVNAMLASACKPAA